MTTLKMSWWGLAKTCVNKRLVEKGWKIFKQPFPIIFPTCSPTWKKICLWLFICLKANDDGNVKKEKWLVQQVWEIGNPQSVSMFYGSCQPLPPAIIKLALFPILKQFLRPPLDDQLQKLNYPRFYGQNEHWLNFHRTLHWESVLTLRYCFHYLKFPLFNVYWNWKPDSNG